VSVEYVEKVYDRYSKLYDVIFGKVFHSGREMAPELLELKPGHQLLEVGVGTGLSLPMLPKDIDITGVDLSQKMLDEARKRVEKLDYKHVELIKMDATKLEFPDDSFDRVLAAYFISVVPDPVAVVAEMKRVCRPGGYLLFLNHFLSDNPVLAFFEKVLSPVFFKFGFYSDLNLHKLMDKCGLEIETLELIDGGFWKAVRCVNPEKAE